MAISFIDSRLRKLNEEKRSSFGYNNLYSRSFVNKVISIEGLLGSFNTKHLITLLLKLHGKAEKGYLTITTIKCFIILKKKLEESCDRTLLNRLKELFIMKVRLFQKSILAYDHARENTTRFRALKILLMEIEAELL